MDISNTPKVTDGLEVRDCILGSRFDFRSLNPIAQGTRFVKPFSLCTLPKAPPPLFNSCIVYEAATVKLDSDVEINCNRECW